MIFPLEGRLESREADSPGFKGSRDSQLKWVNYVNLLRCSSTVNRWAHLPTVKHRNVPIRFPTVLRKRPIWKSQQGRSRLVCPRLVIVNLSRVHVCVLRKLGIHSTIIYNPLGLAHTIVNWCPKMRIALLSSFRYLETSRPPSSWRVVVPQLVSEILRLPKTMALVVSRTRVNFLKRKQLLHGFFLNCSEWLY